MKRTVIDTEDNSKTLLIDNTDITYHSRHGAVTESNHIFIKNGLEALKNKKSISVFEMGFGTGLNALLACQYSVSNNTAVTYHTIEKYPISNKELNAISSSSEKQAFSDNFKALHECEWELPCQINANFNITKFNADLIDHILKANTYDIIFFDAFGPKFQPNLWQPPILKKLYHSLKNNGLLLTYCAQGQFKRDLKTVGFIVENLPGPPGKREITRAIKQ